MLNIHIIKRRVVKGGVDQEKIHNISNKTLQTVIKLQRFDFYRQDEESK